MNKLKKLILTQLVALRNDNSGFTVIEALIWGAIVVLAVISIQAAVTTALGTYGTSWAAWLAAKATAMFK